MNDYTGKICPYCKTAFQPDDEIVVCSECDMPHHKDCWVENQGCTTFGCIGTIKSADNGSSSVTAREIELEDTRQPGGAVVYCTKCGAPNANTSSFCSKCGSRLTTAAAAQGPAFRQANPASTNPYAYAVWQGAAYCQSGSAASFGYSSAGADADIQKLVGTKSEYYLPKFQEMKAQNKKTSWNWPAFLVSPYWMIYRKMYAYGAVVLGVSFVLSLLGATVGFLLALCGYIALGLFGNYIYLNFLEKKALQAKAMNEPFKAQFLAQNGGVNSTAAVLAAVGYAILMIVLSLL